MKAFFLLLLLVLARLSTTAATRPGSISLPAGYHYPDVPAGFVAAAAPRCSVAAAYPE